MLVALAVQAFVAAAFAAPLPSAPSALVPVAAPAIPPDPLIRRARLARQFEDLGEYDSAAVTLRALSAQMEFAVALDLARAGAPDSARVLLHGPLLSAALADSCPPARRRPYGPDRDALWTNGVYDGWRWTIARARAEVDARLGRWEEARAEAR